MAGGPAPTLHVVRVFCAEDGSGGNHLGVFLDGPAIEEGSRQAIAHDLGYAETVFVDDRDRAELRIFTPTQELPLAGHPLVGAAWLLREEGTPAETLRPPAGEVAVRFEDELAFIAADPEWGPPWDLIELDTAEEVDALTGPPEGHEWAYVWSSLGEGDVSIRARAFAAGAGVGEDEATGSAALRLVAQLGRPIQIRQGPTAGSLIYARPLDGRAEVGGLVALDEARSYSLS
jgi:predicted PhzF superfamily epimerase YddE/YHI9